MARLLVFAPTIDNPLDAFEWVECNELEDYYKHLGCRCFDIANRKVGNKRFDIFVDDEGLFDPNNLITAVDTEMNPMLVGNLIFANHDAEGNTTSLEKDDIQEIVNSTRFVTMKNKETGEIKETVVIMCDY